jgi:hypothetical protein
LGVMSVFWLVHLRHFGGEFVPFHFSSSSLSASLMPFIPWESPTKGAILQSCAIIRGYQIWKFSELKIPMSPEPINFYKWSVIINIHDMKLHLFITVSWKGVKEFKRKRGFEFSDFPYVIPPNMRFCCLYFNPYCPFQYSCGSV